MDNAINHIILLCDDESKASEACHLIGSVDPFLHIHLIYSFAELLKLLERIIPKLIIVYVVSKKEAFSTYVKKLRKENHFDTIPIYLFSKLPSREEIKILADQAGRL